MKYKVTCIHHDIVWRRGDLEAADIINEVKVFKTKKEVVSYLTTMNSYWVKCKCKTRLVTKRGIDPELIVDTGKTWTHENTGSEHRETYWYRTEKV